MQTVESTQTIPQTTTVPAGSLEFGTRFSDHMLLANYDEASGWHAPRIEPFASFHLSPATAVLHYGQAVFEGIKAFRGIDGKVRLFRPQAYIERLRASADRLCIPAPDAGDFLEWLVDLVRADRDCVHEGEGQSLYIRPAIIADEAFLGVRPARSYLLFAISCPVQGYYGPSMSPVRIRVEETYVRAAEGGIGDAKTGGNYAASLKAAAEAHRDGFTQVLWLDGKERRYMEEIGTMNVMLRIGDGVVTPPLGGSILAGVTRDSVLTLLREWGIPASERRIALDEVVAAYKAGDLKEIWGTGTAAGIAPVGELCYRGEVMTISDGLAGKLSVRLARALTEIQYGAVADYHGWTVEV